MSVVDFALKASNDQDADVRKCAIDLLKSVKLKGGKDKLDNILIESKAIKKIFAKQLWIIFYNFFILDLVISLKIRLLYNFYMRNSFKPIFAFSHSES